MSDEKQADFLVGRLTVEGLLNVDLLVFRFIWKCNVRVILCCGYMHVPGSKSASVLARQNSDLVRNLPTRSLYNSRTMKGALPCWSQIRSRLRVPSEPQVPIGTQWFTFMHQIWYFLYLPMIPVRLCPVLCIYATFPFVYIVPHCPHYPPLFPLSL